MRLAAAAAVAWACAGVAALVLGLRVPWPKRFGGGGGIRDGGGARVRRVAWLQQAGLTVLPAQFAAASAAVGATVFVCGDVLFGPYVAAMPAVAAVCAPRAYYSRRRAQRLAVMQRAWPDGLRDLVSAVAAGMSIHQGLMELAAHGPEPLQQALVRYPSLSRAVGVTPALEIMRAELADPVSDRVIEVLVLASERGGSIVRAILSDLATAISADIKLLEALDTEILESRINARAVVVLPWFVLLVMNLSHGPFRAFYRSAAGLVVIVVGAVLSACGSALIARLGRTPNEQRVFDGARP